MTAPNTKKAPRHSARCRFGSGEKTFRDGIHDSLSWIIPLCEQIRDLFPVQHNGIKEHLQTHIGLISIPILRHDRVITQNIFHMECTLLIGLFLLKVDGQTFRDLGHRAVENNPSFIQNNDRVNQILQIPHLVAGDDEQAVLGQDGCQEFSKAAL